MPPKLRAVTPGESAPQAPPTTLVEATERTRREFLVMARRRIATEIDGGAVPAHALGRLIAEMDRLDSEVRRMDALDEQEAERGSGRVADDTFDASAI